MAFHDVRFPTDLSFGAVGGPERRTEIVTLRNGFEERSTPWADSLRRFDAGLGMRSLDDLERLVAFFEERRGQLHGFRWKDWSDYKSCPPSAAPTHEDQPLGTGDGARTRFDLVKAYGLGAHAWSRRIGKPVAGSVLVAVGGDPLQQDVHFTLDAAAGTVELAVPAEDGAAVTAGFEFDLPVRFDTDRIAVSVATFEAGEVPEVPVVEIRL
ncbi:MAG: phage distal tail protein, Rcc01695 family [Hasllibacter sp.]